jgi:hypothetical protein
MVTVLCFVCHLQDPRILNVMVATFSYQHDPIFLKSSTRSWLFPRTIIRVSAIPQHVVPPIFSLVRKSSLRNHTLSSTPAFSSWARCAPSPILDCRASHSALTLVSKGGKKSGTAGISADHHHCRAGRHWHACCFENIPLQNLVFSLMFIRWGRKNGLLRARIGGLTRITAPQESGDYRPDALTTSRMEDLKHACTVRFFSPSSAPSRIPPPLVKPWAGGVPTTAGREEY